MDTLVLLLILGGILSVFHHWEYVCCRLIIYSLYYAEVGSFYAHVLKRFNHKWVLNFVKCFFCIYWDYHMIFISQFVNMVSHIEWFVHIEESLHPWNKLDYGVWAFWCAAELCLLKFWWGFLHLCLSVILAFSFLFCVLSLSGFSITVIVAS